MLGQITRLYKIFLQSKLSTFLIELFFFTNSWILGYYFVLQFLNENFPFLKDSSSFLANRFHQEPFENPLYIILSVAVAILIFIYFSNKDRLLKFTTRIKSKILLYKSIFLFTLVSVFLSRLADYPLRDSIASPSNNFILYTLILTLIFVVFRVIKKKVFVYLCITGIIAVLTFTPRFPIGTNDYSAFFGPMIEASNGKTIYTEFNSQYGFLSVLFFGFMYKYGFDLMYTSIIIWGLYILQYFLSFHIIYKITRSPLFALLGLFSILTISYYSLIHLPSMIPQNIFRYPQILLAIVLFLHFKDLRSKIFIFLISLLSFWTVDTGIVLNFGYILTLFFLFLKRQIVFRDLIFTILYFFLNLLSIYLLINLSLIALGYKTINTVLIFEQIRNHGQLGFNMVPMPDRTFFWFFVLIYFASIIYFVKDKANSLSSKIILFIANMSLLINIYYIGRSIDHNLFHISIFALLNLLIVIGLFLKRRLNNNAVLLAIFIALVLIPAYNRQYAISGIIDKNLKNLALGDIFEPEIKKHLTHIYKDELVFVNKNISEREIIILSPDDTYLFYLFKKKNLLNGNPQGEYFLKEDVVRAVSEGSKICPKKIITSCSLFNKQCSEDLLFFDYYHPTSMQAILLNELEKGCKFQYKPKECTKRLCIAEKEASD